MIILHTREASCFRAPWHFHGCSGSHRKKSSIPTNFHQHTQLRKAVRHSQTPVSRWYSQRRALEWGSRHSVAVHWRGQHWVTALGRQHWLSPALLLGTEAQGNPGSFCGGDGFPWLGDRHTPQLTHRQRTGKDPESLCNQTFLRGWLYWASSELPQ